MSEEQYADKLESLLAAERAKVKELEAQNAVMREKLIQNQEPLGEPFSSVLYNNVEKMTKDLAEKI